MVFYFSYFYKSLILKKEASYATYLTLGVNITLKFLNKDLYFLLHILIANNKKL